MILIRYALLVVLCSVAVFTHSEDKKIGKFYGAKTAPLPAWFKQSFLEISDDLAEAKESGRFVMIYFHQDSCPYCAKLVEDNFHNPELVAKLRKNFDVIEINMWGDKSLVDWQGRAFSEKEFAQLMRVQFTPTLLFLDENGKVLLRLNGYQSTAKMHVVLDYISSRAYQHIAFVQYKDSLAKPSVATKLALLDYFDTPPFVLSRSEQRMASQKLAVIFTKPNCRTCTEFYREFLQNPYNVQLLKKMQVVQLNIDRDQKLITPNGKKTTAKKWYELLKLTDLPAMVFFDEKGQEIIRKDAYFKTFHFQSILHYAIDNGYQKYSSFQRYIEHRADTIRKSGQDVNIWH